MPALTFLEKQFYLNEKELLIVSGAVHYFRVVPEYWEERLLQLKAAGLNTVETYCPWNLHEEIKGEFNFEGMLNIRSFLEKVHQLGLYAIIRPGPYICSEWEFGGLPSWLLRDPNMVVRSNYSGFMEAVDRYFRILFQEINDLQYSKGGPIISFQIENEFGSYGSDLEYMKGLKKMMEKHGVDEMMLVADSDEGMVNTAILPGVLTTATCNKKKHCDQLVKQIQSLNLKFPIFVVEFWTGWFHAWGDQSNASFISVKKFEEMVSMMLEHGYSINFYMFHGGTNFGFMNGTVFNNPLITSYDYEAPVSECGRTNEKYAIMRDIILRHLQSEQVSQLPKVPVSRMPQSYGEIKMLEYLPLAELIHLCEAPVESSMTLTMEELPINSDSGQAFGFTLYRTTFGEANQIVLNGTVEDRGLVFVDAVPKAEVSSNDFVLLSKLDRATFDVAFLETGDVHVLDILVENMGRVSYTRYGSLILNQQRKGFRGTVHVDTEDVHNWKIFPLEFKAPFMESVSQCKKWLPFAPSKCPALYRASLVLTEPLQDTFFDMQGWTKGVVFINGHNLGRYWNIGPQRTLYCPAPWLVLGKNEIAIFELHEPGVSVTSTNNPIFEYAEQN